MADKLGLNQNLQSKIPQENVKTASLEADNIKNGNVQNVNKPDTLQRSPLEDEFHTTMRQNTGLIERFYDWVKNKTGSKLGSDSIKKDFERAKRGEISEEEMSKKLESYRTSQESSAQMLGDAASVGTAAAYFLSTEKTYLNNNLAFAKHADAKKFKELCTQKVTKQSKWNTIKKIYEHFNTGKNLIEDRKMQLLATAIGAALYAGAAKLAITSINRIGTKEFKSDNPDKKERREENKELRREWWKSTFRNYASGCLNGLMTPLITVGGYLGAPLYLAANSLNRYFVGHHTSENKSFGNYFDHLKSDVATNVLFMVPAGLAMTKYGNTKLRNSWKKLTADKNFDMKKIANKGKFETASADEDAKNISGLILESDNVKNIYNARKTVGKNEFYSGWETEISLEEAIKSLSEKNIMALKFLQIAGEAQARSERPQLDGIFEFIPLPDFLCGNDKLAKLAKLAKENCPPSRTIEEARTEIEKLLKTLSGGAEGYDLKGLKRIGVGTIAETYVAEKGGKKIAIKILKNGVNAESIQKSAEECKKIIDTSGDKYSDALKQEYKKSIDQYAEAMKKELNLLNESKNAEALANVTHEANVVKSIAAGEDIHVMEYVGDSISLEKFLEIQKALSKIRNSRWERELLDKSADELRKLKSDWDNCYTKYRFNLDDVKEVLELKEKQELYGCHISEIVDPEKIKMIYEQYQRVISEQFNRLPQSGQEKVTHADIHSGNIMINVEALQKGDAKNLFTLIDTGNVVRQSAEETARMLNFEAYLNNGYVKGIVDIALQGVEYPNGMTEAKAREELTKDLNELFFGNTRGIAGIDSASLLKYIGKFLQKRGVNSHIDLNMSKARLAANDSAQTVLTSFKNGSNENLKDNLRKKVAGEECDIWGALGDVWTFRDVTEAKIAGEEFLHNSKIIDSAKITLPSDMLKPDSVDYLKFQLKRSGQKQKNSPMDYVM